MDNSTSIQIEVAAGESEAKIRVLVAAKNPTSLNGILSMLEQYEDFEMVESALDGEECLQKIEAVPADVLLAEINLPKISGVKIAEYLSLERPDLATVILADQSTLGFFRTAMLAGAMDFLTMPIPAEELAFSIKRVHQLRAERRRKNSCDTGTSGGVRLALGRCGKVVTVCGGKGGTGKSTVSALVASFLKERARLSVALADFDLQFGDLAVLYNIQPRKSLLDLLPLIDELDAGVVRSASLRLNGGPDLFLSPPQLEKSELIAEGHVAKLVEGMRETYDLIIANTGPRISEVHLDLFEVSDLVVVVVDQDIPSLKACAQVKSVYEKLGLPSESLVAVVNKFEPGGELALDKIGESLDIAVIGSIRRFRSDELEALRVGLAEVDGWSSSLLEAIKGISAEICSKLDLAVQFEAEEVGGRRFKWLRFLRG